MCPKYVKNGLKNSIFFSDFIMPHFFLLLPLANDDDDDDNVISFNGLTIHIPFPPTVGIVLFIIIYSGVTGLGLPPTTKLTAKNTK